ncbi:MAG: TrkA C-terminal domain-containing protein [Candidatus Nanopelagicales bacterium]|nr:TrkA C-terminal domain-containing protein [Candidatus Nanopelagicales bacterium]
MQRSWVGRRLTDITTLNERGILVLAVSRNGLGLPELATPEVVLGARDVLVVCGPEDELTPLLA